MMNRRISIGLGIATLALAVVLGGPFVRYRMDPAYEGRTPIRLQDDGAYFSRIQTALLGRSGPYENGITSPEFSIRAAGPALLERTEGRLFSWTGWNGVDVGTLVMIVFGTLTLPLLYVFLRSFEVRPSIALTGAVLFCAATTGILIRPHLAVLMPLSILALLCVQRLAMHAARRWIIPAALLLSLLPALYFWSWMFVWASCASFFVLRWFEENSARRTRVLRMLSITASLAFLVALPALVSTWILQTADPAFPEMSLYRSGLYPSHAIDSPLKSGLQLLLVAAGILLFVRKRHWRASLSMPLALVIGVFLVIHQHVIHGRDFLSSSHYEPMVTLSAVCIAAWAIERWSRDHSKRLVATLSLILASCFILLAAAASDYRLGWTFFLQRDVAVSTRHLAPAIDALNDGTRNTILTDARTAVEVTSRTEDNVVFTPYVQHLLVSNAEFAARGCMADLFQPGGPDIEALAWHTLQFKGQFMLPQRTAEFRLICMGILEDPTAALERYGVDLILWNETERPEWVMPGFLSKIRQGSGWSLWRVH